MLPTQILGFLIGKPEGNDWLGDLEIDGRILKN
jgi:hypothetical protein